MAIPPPVLREMTLREIHAHLLPLTPADGREALMAQHPHFQGGGRG